jgi:uncharacterized protein involved in exopolysaccharide biosynthesis
MARSQITWNRDDRDLIVELRTQMGNVRDEIAAARTEIKEINTGITSRLLNLEANAVTKLVVEALDERVSNLEESRTKYRTQLNTILAIGGLAITVLNIGLLVYFHFH